MRPSAAEEAHTAASAGAAGGGAPPGWELLQAAGLGVAAGSRTKGAAMASYGVHRAAVLVLTFVVYVAFHASRKPPSIVKNALTGNDAAPPSPPAWDHEGTAADMLGLAERISPPPPPVFGDAARGWAPFNQDGGTKLLSTIDGTFLFTYAVAMFFSGHLGDRLDLRGFLAVGMLGSGLAVCLFGMGYFWDIHSMNYYVAVMIFGGIFQSTGWPCVVTVVGNWFGKSKRGLIMGVWNAHTSVGNILGAIMAASALPYGWGWSFVVPGVFMGAIGVVVALFLVVQPEDVGLPSPHHHHDRAYEQDERHDDHGASASLLDNEGGGGAPSSGPSSSARSNERKALSFTQAFNIPGVAAFSFCLFFAKLVAYTFLYWLPFYISKNKIAGRQLSDKDAGNLSVLFDVGGIVGGIFAGYMSDRFNARSCVAAGMVLTSIPCMYLYSNFGHIAMELNIFLMMITGFFVNGPYALITTAVSADLGTHESLKGNSKALAMVTAIIDGTGSFGAAVGPSITGWIEPYGWTKVFLFLYFSAAAAACLIGRQVMKELGIGAASAGRDRAGSYGSQA